MARFTFCPECGRLPSECHGAFPGLRCLFAVPTPNLPVAVLSQPNQLSAIARFHQRNRDLRDRWRRWNAVEAADFFFARWWDVKPFSPEGDYSSSQKFSIAMLGIAAVIFLPVIPLGMLGLGIWNGSKKLVSKIIFGE